MTFPLLYEINTRCWLAELSEKTGQRITLANVPNAEFDWFERCGFTDIWLMGIWTLGARGRGWSRRCYAGKETEFGCDELAGSPYAICGYTVGRRVGGDSALAVFRRKLKERGIRMILDFIPNHTALDHPWVREHPDWYVTSANQLDGFVKPFRGANRWYAHGDCGHGSPWIDTLQLNYASASLRAAMIRELERVSDRCDGVRCDMAMLVLRAVFQNTWNIIQPAADAWPEFWDEAISAVRARKRDFLFVAEVYWDCERTLQELGFDFTYDKRLYDIVLADSPGAVAEYLLTQPADFHVRSVHFIENHDEPRIASLMPPEKQQAAALLVAALPGMRLFHEGQFAGWKLHANVHFSKRRPQQSDLPLQRWYEGLFAALKHSAVGRGTPMLLTPMPAWVGNSSHANFVIVQWQGGTTVNLAVINMSAERSQCCVMMRCPDLAIGAWRAIDLLGSEVHDRDGSELAEKGFYLDVPGFAAQLFHFTRPA